MTLFSPNQRCVLVKMGNMDIYGQKHVEKRITENCAILKSKKNSTKSSVRADSSASRGNAQEITADYWLILENSTQADIDDLIEFRGLRLKIIGLHPRFSIRGEHDHTEALCKIWNEKDDD